MKVGNPFPITTNIYLYLDKSVIGPYTFCEVQDKLNNNELNLTDLFCYEGDTRWHELKVLFTQQYVPSHPGTITKTLNETKKFVLSTIKNIPHKPIPRPVYDETTKVIYTPVPYRNQPTQVIPELQGGYKHKNMNLQLPVVSRSQTELVVVDKPDKHFVVKIICISILVVLLGVFAYTKFLNLLLDHTKSSF